MKERKNGNQFGPEQRFVIETFQEKFASQKNRKIVLYGIGKNSEAVLFGTEGFCFAGLMDQAATGQTIYGQRVLSKEEVIKLHPIIVVIARQSVVGIIWKRIQSLSTEHGILIYDFQGKLLGQESLKYQNEDLPYWEASAQELAREMKEHDIVTFDVFDTLLMRKTLLPTDVFELAEKELCRQGQCYPFARMRQDTELLLGGYPSLDEIYSKMKEQYGLEDTLVKQMRSLECRLDSSMLMRREEMCQLFQEAVREGKKVYLLSDMYYSKPYLGSLLRKHGVTGYQDLFVSCDLKKGKSDGSMYQWLRPMIGAGRWMHVGDNRRVDVEKARESGLDAYHIYSAYELLMASSIQDVLAEADTLGKRCILGLFASRMFHDPFVLGPSKGYLKIEDMEDVGYCFVAPMLAEFAKWLNGRIKEHGIQQVLFPSRDGYLMEKVYKAISDSPVETVYFRASRRAVSVATLYGQKDIRRMVARGYHGTYGDYLKFRFGVPMEERDSRRHTFIKNTQDEMTEQILRDYEVRILENGLAEREQYLRYLEGFGLRTGKCQAVFDFVAGGTVQYGLSRLLGHNPLGLYFATMNLPNTMYSEDTSEIEAAYGNIQSYGSDCQLGRHYLVLEAILGDDKCTFSHIGFDGEEVFEQGEERRNYTEIERLQRAVLEYTTDCRRYFPHMDEELELKGADMLFGMLFSDRCLVSKKVKQVFYNEDVYDGVASYSLWGE